MTEQQIRFDDGAAYERMMGVWSQLAGEQFLDWLAPAVGQRWIDAGCGNGAFTELIVQRCAPTSVDGVDPSEGQLAFARTRPASRIARFKQGDAMVLPYADKSFDVAVMALVIFTVQRTFVDFDDFLSVGLTTPSIGPIVRAMQSGDVDTLKARLRDRLPVDANGRIMCSARANAVKGRVRK